MKNAVVLISDEKYTFAMGNVICQLKNHCYIDTIFIIVQQASDEVVESLLTLDSRVKTLVIDHDLFKTYLSERLLKSQFVCRWGTLPFLRFMALPLLKDYDNLVFLDIDILILRPFNEAITNASISFRGRCSLSIYDRRIPQEFKMPNAGVVIVSRAITNTFQSVESLRDECFKILNEFSNTENVDEFVWGYLVYKYKLTFRDLPSKFNCFPCQSGSRSATIVHGAASYKFWTHQLVNVLFPEWRANLEDLYKKGVLRNISQLPENALTEDRLFNSIFALEMFQEFANDERFQIVWKSHAGFVTLIPKCANLESFRIYLISRMYCLEVRVEDVNEYRKHNPYFRKMFYSHLRGFRVISDKGTTLACSKFIQKNELTGLFNSFYTGFKSFAENYSKLSMIASEYCLSFDFLQDVKGNQNNIILIDENGGVTFNNDIPGLNVSFVGEDNLLVIRKPIYFKDVQITLGSNNIVSIENSEFDISNVAISLGQFTCLVVKKNFSADQCSITSKNELSACLIDSDCVFDQGVTLELTDIPQNCHFTKEHGFIYIGSFTEVGKDVLIKSNTYIEKKSCIRSFSVVNLISDKEGACISGRPAFVF